MSGATRPTQARGRAGSMANNQAMASRGPTHGHMHMSGQAQIPGVTYNTPSMYIPGTPMTFSGGQITTPMPGFPQQYYVVNPNGSAAASPYWQQSVMPTQSLPVQTQPQQVTARPSSNPGISGAGPPNITMSSSFNGNMPQSQMQPPAQTTPYPPQQLQQSSTRMSSTAMVPIVQPVQQPIAGYGKQERKRNVIPIVDPTTKAIVNKDAMATNMTPTNKGTSPASSNSSTPQPAPVESDQGVRVEHSHFSKNVEIQPSQASAVSDISAQFKAQVAHVASLSSSSVSVVSESTPPVMASNLRNGGAEPTTSHPEKEAPVKVITRSSTEEVKDLAEVDQPSKADDQKSTDRIIHPSTSSEQLPPQDKHVEPIQTEVVLSSQEETAKPKDSSSSPPKSHPGTELAKVDSKVASAGVDQLDTPDFVRKTTVESESVLPEEADKEQLVPTADPLTISSSEVLVLPNKPEAQNPVTSQSDKASSDVAAEKLEASCVEDVAHMNEQTDVHKSVTETLVVKCQDPLEKDPVVKSAPSDRELMPPPPPVASSTDSRVSPHAITRPTISPVTENKENTPSPTSSSPVKASKIVSSQNSQPPVAMEHKLDDSKLKTYTRDFLMSLKEANLSQVKPEGLGTAILHEITYSGRALPSMSVGKKDFNPDYYKPNSSPRGSVGNKRSSMSRDNKSIDATAGGRQQHKIKFIREEVKLKSTENAWKPGDKTTANFTEDEKAHLDLLKKFRGMLNKITPSTFSKLLVQILELPVKSEKDLTEVMILLFDKARNEPEFCRVYANLCQAIAKEYKVRKEDGEEVNFRKVLLVRCQKEFEATDKDDQVMADKLKNLEKALKTAETDEEKARLNEEFKSAQTKVRHRKLGYMRFLGELYVLRMLTGNIMHQCVTSLLKAPDEESLEYLCKLWTTIGKTMDIEEKARTYNDQYFTQMRKIASGQIRNVGVRIKFALKDVIELRENNWVPRRDKNVPKTLQEIHKQMAMEEQEKQQMIDKNLPTRNSQQGRAPPLPRNNRRGDDQDGWSHVKTGSQRVDPTKLKLTSQKMVGADKELQLGPAKGFGGWSRGSSGSGKNTPPQQEEKSAASSNRFSAFTMNDRELRDNRSQSGNRMTANRSGAKSRGRGPGAQRMGTPRGSMEKEKNSAVEMARQLSREPRLNSRENSMERRNMRTPTPTGVVMSRGSAQSTPTPVKQMSRNDWDTKMKSIIDEYLHNNDIKEVLEIVREELAGQKDMMLMTECAINHTLERSTQARRGTGLMLAELLKHKLLSLDAHMKGLGAVLEFADDLAIDIPNVWEYFGEVIAPTFTTASVPLEHLEFICSPLMSIGKASLLAAAVLKEASHNIGHVEIGKRWAAGKLDWSRFLADGEDQHTFIQSNKLEYTVSAQPPTPSSSGVAPSDTAAQLEKFMLEGVENESVFDWIDSKLSPDMRNEAAFIRSLTTSVVYSCIADTSLNESKFKSRIPLLHRYYDNKPNREMAALSALEDLMTKLQHPANLFSDLCYAVSDNDLIADESFLSWEKNSNNGIAVKSVGKFLQWMKEETST